MPEPAPTPRPEFDPIDLLAAAFRGAIASLEGAPADADPLITPSKQAALGDFQCNAAMPLAKALGRKPRDVAAELVARVGPSLVTLIESLNESSIAGPGFINIRLRPEALARLLERLDTPALGLEPPEPTERQTVVVDLCGVNLAKQMHVGHLRSTVIGDALARLFERLGHQVVRQNHVGDWGLPIAMVTRKLMELRAAGSIDLARVTLDDLDRLYREAKAEATPPAGLKMWRAWAAHPKVAAEFEDGLATMETEAERAEANLAASKQTLVRLQNHDADVEAVWKRLYEVTMGACLENCQRLRTRITERDSAGESSYREELAPLVSDLIGRGVAEEEAGGAVVVRVEGIEEPCLIRKSDGGFLYATTDVAAIRRRVRTIGADRVVYCVDARQALHFRQVFGAAQQAEYAMTADGKPVALEHAAFGMVLGEDRRPFKTRSGENVRLSALLDEAIARAGEKVAETNPDLSEADRAPIAEVVGIAAIKYADLSNDRIKDYVFSFDRMIALQGNTGPYLLYALARIRSIFRKAQEQGIRPDRGTPIRVVEAAEKTLALALLGYPSSVRRSAEHLEPHRLCAHLYDLAQAFSGFFENCPVLKADGPIRESRLRLCDLTARVLSDGLETLGIPATERM